MKILHITQAYYPAIQWGGPIVSVRTLAKELARTGHEVTVYTTTFGLSTNKTSTATIDGVRVVYFRSYNVWRWHVPFGALGALRRTMEDFDIVHLHSVWDPMIWIAGALLIGKKTCVVISPRGCIDPVLIRKRSFLLKKTLYALVVKRMFLQSAGIHFTSSFEKERFIAFTNIDAPSQITANALDREEFQPMARADAPLPLGLENTRYFLYLGRINWKKGLELLVGAFSKIAQDVTGVLLVIAGPDEDRYKHRIERLAVEKQLGSRMVFTGLVQGQEKVALLRQAAALVLPSYSENFGIVVAEALAAGTPVIISHGVGISPLVVSYQAGIVVAMDEEALARALREILKDDAARRAMGANGVRLVRDHFDPRAVTEKMLAFYDAVRRP